MRVRRQHMLPILFLVASSFLLRGAIASAQDEEFHESFDDPGQPGWETSAGASVIDGTLRLEPGNIAFIPIASRSIRVRVLREGQAQLQIHYQRTESSAYILSLRSEGMAVLREIDGQVQELNGTDIGLPADRWVEVQIDMMPDGHRIRVPELDAAFDFQPTADLPPGGVLLRVEGEASCRFDDLVLSGLTEAGRPGGQSPGADDVIPPTDEIPAQPVPANAYSWTYCGGPSGGLGYDIRMHPSNHEIVFVSDGKAGVFKSFDRGVSWVPASSGITTRMGASSDEIPVFSISIDPNNPDRLWAGTQYSSGIYRSDDGAETWTMMNQGVQEEFISVRGFTVEPGNSDVVYMAGEVSSWEWHGEPLPGLGLDQTKGVVYKTTDAGQRWQRIWYGDNLTRYIWINPQNTDLIYVSTGIFDREAANASPEELKPGGVGVLRSRDGGKTWEVLGAGHGFDPLDLYIGSLYMHPENPDILYAAAGNGVYGPTGGLYRTVDGGDHWDELIDVHSLSVVEICDSDPDVIYAASINKFFRSSDGGETWKEPNPTAHFWGPEGIPAGFPIDAQCDLDDPNRVLINNYVGGALLTEDGGVTWTNSSRGYTGAMMSQISVVADSPAEMYASARSGLFRSADGCQSWEGIGRGPAETLEGLAIAVDPFDPLHVLTTLADAGPGPKATRDGGATWEGIEPGFWRPEEFGQIVLTRFKFDPGQQGRVLASVQHQFCYERMWCSEFPGEGMILSDDGGLTWRRTSLTDGNVTAIAHTAAGGGVWYAALYEQGLFRSDDGGETWSLVNGHPYPANLDLSSLPPEFRQEVMLRALAVDPLDADRLYAGIYRNGFEISEDGGRTWTSSSAGLPPETQPMDIVLDPVERGILYLGTLDSGVFISSDSGATWSAVNAGLINRAIEDLDISSDGAVIYASTEGAGVFRLGPAPDVAGTLAQDQADEGPEGNRETSVAAEEPAGEPDQETGGSWCPGSYLPLMFVTGIFLAARRRGESRWSR